MERFAGISAYRNRVTIVGVEAVAIGTVGDIVPVLFHPVGQRIFPEEKFA